MRERERERENDFNGLSYFRITRTERQNKKRKKKQNHILSLCINKSRGGFTCCSSLSYSTGASVAVAVAVSVGVAVSVSVSISSSSSVTVGTWQLGKLANCLASHTSCMPPQDLLRFVIVIKLHLWSGLATQHLQHLDATASPCRSHAPARQRNAIVTPLRVICQTLLAQVQQQLSQRSRNTLNGFVN